MYTCVTCMYVYIYQSSMHVVILNCAYAYMYFMEINGTRSGAARNGVRGNSGQMLQTQLSQKHDKVKTYDIRSLKKSDKSRSCSQKTVKAPDCEARRTVI